MLIGPALRGHNPHKRQKIEHICPVMYGYIQTISTAPGGETIKILAD